MHERRCTACSATKKKFTSFDDMIANSDTPLLVDFYATWCADIFVDAVDKVWFVAPECVCSADTTASHTIPVTLETTMICRCGPCVMMANVLEVRY